MDKKAWWGPIKAAITGALGAVNLSNHLFAAAMLGAGLMGSSAGWAIAKATAHDDADTSIAKKEYGNERLKADIGYLSGQLDQERRAQGLDTQGKPARVISL